MALFFALVYTAVPFIAWNAASRLNSGELQQTLAVREGAERQFEGLKARIAGSNTAAELEAIPGLAASIATRIQSKSSRRKETATAS